MILYMKNNDIVMGILDGFLGESDSKPLDISVALIISERGLDPLDVEQWKMVVDKIRERGAQRVIFVSEDAGETTMNIIKYARDMEKGVILAGYGITPEKAIDLQRMNISWILISLEDTGDNEIRGVKTAVAAGLNITGVISSDGRIMEKKEFFEDIGIENIVVGDIPEYDLEIGPTGKVTYNGDFTGHILVDSWDDICPAEDAHS